MNDGWEPSSHWSERTRNQVRRLGWLRWQWRTSVTISRGLEQPLEVARARGRAFTRAGADMKASNAMVKLQREAW